MAGFWAGFGEQMSTNIEQRQKTLDRMIEENLDNARLAKTNYSKRKGTADQVLKSAKAIRDKFGLSEEQALAVTEAYGTDLPKLQATLDAENDKLRSNLGVSYTADDVMSFVNISGELSKAKGTSLDEGVKRLMGLNYQELAKEPDPKAEGSKVRSFIRSALAFDPQLRAAEQMQNIKGPGGLSYAQLLEMQEAGFAPEDVYGDVTRAGGVTYDYTASTASQTRNDYSRRLSAKVFSADLTDPVDFGNYTGGDGEDKAQLKATVQGAGEAIARLEKDIVLANRGTDLAMNAFRKGILDDIYSRVDTAEELDTLRESINNGTALEIVQRTGGKLTDRDIDAIILGVEPEEGEDAAAGGDSLEGATPETATAVPSILDEATKSVYDSLPEEDKPDLAGVEDPDVARMIVEQAAENAGTETEAPDATIDKIKTESEFIQTYFDDVLDFFEEVGIDRTDKNDIKLALADWFSDNAEKLDIPSTLRTDDMAEIIFKAFNE